MRILLINDATGSIGGAESYVEGLKNILLAADNEVEQFGSIKENGLKQTFFSRWFSLRNLILVRRTIKRFKPDVIHIHNVTRIISPSFLLCCKGITVIQTVHDYQMICSKVWMLDDAGTLVEEHNSLLRCFRHHLPKRGTLYDIGRIAKQYLHWKIIQSHVSVFICPSSDLSNLYLSKLKGIAEVRTLSNFMPEDISAEKINQTNRWLYVGRLSKEKGIEVLIAAFNTVSRSCPSARLAIVGEGPERTYLEKEVKRLNLQDRIHFHGKTEREGLSKFYEESSAVIIPSVWTENCPIVALEAIAACRGIIASTSGGLKDLVLDDETGLFFEPGNVKQLAQLLERIYDNPKLLEKFSKSQKEFSSRFTGLSHLRSLSLIYSSAEPR